MLNVSIEFPQFPRTMELVRFFHGNPRCFAMFQYTLQTTSGLWFGTLFFPIIGKFIIPIVELIFFQRARSTTNQLLIHKLDHVHYFFMGKLGRNGHFPNFSRPFPPPLCQGRATTPAMRRRSLHHPSRGWAWPLGENCGRGVPQREHWI